MMEREKEREGEKKGESRSVCRRDNVSMATANNLNWKELSRSIHSLNLWFFFFSFISLTCVCSVLYLLIKKKMLAYISVCIYPAVQNLASVFVLRMARTALCSIRTALLHTSASRRSWGWIFKGVRECWTSGLTDLKTGRLGVLGHHPDKNGRNEAVGSNYPGYNEAVGLGSHGGRAGG